MTQTTLESESAVLVPAAAAVTPYLAVADARRALEWYADAFGARRRDEPVVMPDGRIGHAELDFAGAVVMLADEHPEIGFVAPRPGEGTSVTLHLQVADLDETLNRAVAAGARLDRPPTDHPYGRNAVVTDPFGHRWLLAAAATATPAAAVAAADQGGSGQALPPHANGTRHGDVGHISLEVPDLGRAMAFYQTVLGWTYVPSDSGDGRQVQGATPEIGLSGGKPRGAMVICWRVDDLAAAVEQVRQSGGQAGDPNQYPYGLLVDCVDDQGDRFYLWEPSADEVARAQLSPDRPLNGTRHGDITYLTLEVRDSVRARALYGAVLGWRFSSGRVEDGWGVADPMPMTGMSGGHAVATAVPMFRVDDIEAAVAQVRAAGGTATDPERQPYGRSSECTDDQGTRFYLGQV